jgi:hypothetical protein
MTVVYLRMSHFSIRSGVNDSFYCAGDSLASYNFADSNKFKTIVVFDCRGVEPVEFSPRNGWKVGIIYSTITRVGVTLLHVINLLNTS